MVTQTHPSQNRWSDRRLPGYALVFSLAFVFLFLGMNRGFDPYDEGLILVGAMRVAAGQIPHRDFYANYGPAQFYALAALFDWFGRSILVERLYDLSLRASIVTVVYGISAAYCRKWIVVATTLVCAFWLFSSGLPSIAYPIIPILLLSLLGSALLLPAFRGELQRGRAFGAGAIAGLVLLFRYDVGSALVIIQSLFLVISAFLRRKADLPSAARRRTGALPYALGAAVVFLPPALMYLAVAPIHAIYHDIVLYPAKYYVRARRLPFPGIHWRSLENMALYLPIVVSLLCLYYVGNANSAKRAEGENPEQTSVDRVSRDRDQIGFLLLFGLLETAFYFKGIVRISIGQILLSLILTVVTLAVLYEYSSRSGRKLHWVVQGAVLLSVFSATWAALKEVRVFYLTNESVLQELWSPPGPLAIASETQWCSLANALHSGLCFVVDSPHAQVMEYISHHTVPGERIFIGLSRHDRIMMNDLLSYFVTDRLPATHWAHFDPDLQTRADIQTEMIGEIDRQRVRYIVLESQFDDQVQPYNDSSKSSGVTLLDDYIRTNYRELKAIGSLSIWLRKDAQP